MTVDYPGFLFSIIIFPTFFVIARDSTLRILYLLFGKQQISQKKKGSSSRGITGATDGSES